MTIRLENMVFFLRSYARFVKNNKLRVLYAMISPISSRSEILEVKVTSWTCKILSG
jgi:hypothetical protein